MEPGVGKNNRRGRFGTATDQVLYRFVAFPVGPTHLFGCQWQISGQYRCITPDPAGPSAERKAGTEHTQFEHNSPENIYIQSVKLNGKPFDSFRLSHRDLIQGGTLEIELGPEPNKEWGTGVHTSD